MEGAGQEKWDEDLHRRMAGENEEKMAVTANDINLAHQQLMDAKNVSEWIR